MSRQLRGKAGCEMAGRVPAHGETSSSDAWERWWWLWEVVFCALLAVSGGLTLFDGDAPWQRRGPAVALALVLAGWYWVLVGRSARQRRDYRRMLIYVAGALPLAFALIWLHPNFNLLLFGLYTQVYGLLPLRWSIPSVVLLSGSIALRTLVENGLSSGTITIAILILIGNGIGIIFAFWITAIIIQSRRRQELIDELATTRRELVAAEREAGGLAERQRLAGEIHDTLAQGFVSIVTHLEAAEAALDRMPEADSATLRQHLDDARRAARENLAEARRMVWALRPELLVGGTLPEAIERVARRWSAETGLAAGVTVTGTARPLPPEYEVTLLRATQEALTNVRRHARAGQVAVTLSYLDDVTILDVQDDGRGFDPAHLDLPERADVGGGFGLRGMRERVTGLGGTLAIESAPGEGTTLAIELPVGTSPPVPLSMPGVATEGMERG